MLAWHSVDRCPGITATTVLTLVGIYRKVAETGAPEGNYRMVHFWKLHEI